MVRTAKHDPHGGPRHALRGDRGSVIRLALLGVLIALTACGPTPPAPAPRTPNPPESVDRPAPAPAAAPVAIAPPVAPSMPPELRVRPPVAGSGMLLFLGATARIDGIAITFARSARKQVGRSSTGLFDAATAPAARRAGVHRAARPGREARRDHRSRLDRIWERRTNPAGSPGLVDRELRSLYEARLVRPLSGAADGATP